MKCAICGIEVETIDEAIQQNWIPAFYEGELEHGPVCSSCTEIMIAVGHDGEMELKKEYFGKVRYMDGDYSSKPTPEELEIEIIMTEEMKEQRH